MLDSRSASSIAEIDLRALGENLRRVRERVGRRDVLAVVKANAYGHGAVPIAHYLKNNKIMPALLGVAFLDEGIALRESGIADPILLMTGAPLAQIDAIVQYCLSPVIFDTETLFALNRAAEAAGRTLPIHVKIDTGMGRLGLPPSEALSFIKTAADLPGLAVEGVLSHFAYSDLQDKAFVAQQMARFQTVLGDLEHKGIKTHYRHMANSAAVIDYKPAYLNLVRPGLMLYGYSPAENTPPLPLKPVMQLKARVIAVKKVPASTSISYGRTYVTQRESRIATIAIGYADGYPCILSNRGMMIAKETLVPVVGKVCMDMTMLDVTQVPSLRTGDWVTAIGTEGDRAVWADRVAQWAETHPYEILCGIGPRVHRRYIGS
ncbi:MAG: alanine racemase [Nitrospiria bacterium]